jgi:hypothetical protein
MTNWTKNKVIEYAAGFYQSYDLPDNWDDLSDEELWEVLEAHAWQPYECEQGDEIWERIIVTARMFNRDFNLNVKGI